MHKAAASPLTAGGGLQRYIQSTRKFPVLAADEEVELARRWRDDGDTAAAHALVNSHLRLVTKIAMGYRGYGLPVDELISEGNLGMIQAVRRFDPDRGFRLATYAMWWIRASIQEYILHSWSLVKIGTTAAQKKLFFNLRKIKGRLRAIDEGDMAPEIVTEIANQLHVSESDVVTMNRRLAGADHSLNAPVQFGGDDEWLDWLVDSTEDQEAEFAAHEELGGRRKMLHEAMDDLTNRERRILSERRLKENPLTLEDLSKEYGISRERVRQIEVRAFEKLQKTVKVRAREQSRGRMANQAGLTEDLPAGIPIDLGAARRFHA